MESAHLEACAYVMKRLALGFLLCLPAVQALAATCATMNACTSTAPCDWSDPATWSCGHLPSRARFDSCVITANTTVILRTSGLDCGNTTINGTWLFDESPAGRNPNGYRTFTIGGSITGNAGGVLRLRAGHRLAFDTVAAPRTLTVFDGFNLDVQGQVQEATIAALADDPPNPIDCGQGAAGREFTITPDTGASVAHVTGRVVFLSGRARNRHMEIRAITTGGFSVCTDTVEATSGSDTSGGQRLTPHANRNAFCTGTGKPSACCAGPGRGTCPTTPVSRHSEPAPYGNSACTGAKLPYTCCTGAGTGKCTGAIPAVGDRIAIVYDAWTYQSAGTRGYRIVGDLVSGNDPMPTLKAVNIANAGTPAVNSTSAVEFMARPGVAAPDLEYLNFHDYAPNVDGIRYMGIRNWAVRWSAIHDVTPNTQGNTNATLAVGSSELSADNIAYVDNVFYRTQGVGPHLNEGGAIPATGCKFLRNVLFDSCLAGTNECGGLQADNCTGGEAAYNVLYDYYAGANPLPIAFTLAMQGVGAAVHHNWVVNSGMGPVATSPDIRQIQQTVQTHNYVSHVVGSGGDGGSYFSNVIRNFGLGQSGLASGIVNPINAAGNYILGAEPDILASADCTGAHRCGRIGLEYLKSQSNNNRTPTTARDDIVVSLASYPGWGSEGRCVEFDGYELSGAGGLDADWNATVEHVTCDGRAPTVPIRGISFDQNNASISPSITVSSQDLAMLYNNNGPAIWCTVQPGVDEIFQNIYSLRTDTTSQCGGDYALASDCTSAPSITMVSSMDYQVRMNGDYNLALGSADLVAGSSPPGSPVGARAFRFNRASLQSLWATDPGVANDFCSGPGTPSSCCTGSGTGTCSESVITFDGEFPADVANVDNRDTDGDGVMDLHDNSPANWNPDQLDADGDGIGAATDCNDSNAAVYPGAAETCNGLDDNCDGLVDEGPNGVDPDRDTIAAACDNCPLTWNPLQDDMDSDRQGDACDLDDGMIDILMPDKFGVGWQLEAGFDSFNEYRGDLALLRSSGLYTQDPLTTPSARRNCDLIVGSILDGPAPAPGQVYFYLVSGNRLGIEGSLGTDSSGAERLNSNPCHAH
jgi:putative metal-binding protein